MLNGRLDLVFSQLRMRRYDTGGPSTTKSRRKPALYVEGDSSEEEAVMDVDGDVEIEEDDDDEGSIEDIELGGLGDEARRFREEESSDEDDDDEDEDELDEDSNSDLEGFIDDEAEESEGDGDGSEDISDEEE